MNAVPPQSPSHWLCFTLEARRFALPLQSVTRVVRAAEITPLPHAPDVVAGALNVHGHILPVFDLRRHLRLPARELQVSDEFVIARSARRELALIVDAATGVIEQAAPHPVAADSIAGGRVQDVLSLPDGLVLIEDLEAFLSPAEDRALDSALDAAEQHLAR